MAINIDQFKDNFKDGGARPNLFKVDFTGAPGNIDAWTKMTFTCRASSIPASTLGVIEVPYQGRKIKVAGDRTYAEWPVTILNDEQFLVRRALEEWSHRINHFEENVRDIGLYNLDEYKVDCYVDQLDKSGAVIASYKFVGVYPSEVSAIDVAWDTNDTIEEYNATLQYDYWEPIFGNRIAGVIPASVL